MGVTHLTAFDWGFIIGYGVVAFAIGLVFSRRAGTSMESYFVADRKLPWWVAGTSIVATTFASDTPLAVSGMVRKSGIYENWLWWNALMGGMLCVFFYARLWRRAGLLTDVAFIELRYTGRPAAILRGFYAVYSGVLANSIVLGWVMLAMAKICHVMLGWDRLTSVAVLLLVTLAYTLLAGLWGVVMTDLVQFLIAMIGSVALAVIVLWQVGGPAGLVAGVQAAAADRPAVLDLVPGPHTSTPVELATFVILVSALWWGGGQGGGYLAQRLFATKNEKHAVLAALWFNFAHYVLRPWPWIIVGLASLMCLPASAVADPESAYPLMMAKYLPSGLRGLMVASFLAAFMSTMDTQINWGASYLVNDLYKRFIHPEATPRHFVAVSRMASLLIAGLGALAAWQMESIKGAWLYLAVLGAGGGLLGLLRWFWWRINAWAEITAMAGSLVIANGNFVLRGLTAVGLFPASAMPAVEVFYSEPWWAIRGLVVLAVCTGLWLLVVHLTPPVPADHLEQFYRRVRPGGWWGPIAARCPDLAAEDGLGFRWLGWLLGVVAIYSGLFGIGHLCLDQPGTGLSFLAAMLVAGYLCLKAVEATTAGACLPTQAEGGRR